jgi:hypothetical protein
VLFKCPSSCGEVLKASHSFTTVCKQDDGFILWLAGALVPLEQHSLIHTKEAKATRCEYCNIDLGDTIYWSHLQIHMSGNIDPTSTSPGEKAMMGAGIRPASADLAPVIVPSTTPTKQDDHKLLGTSKHRPPSPPSVKTRPPSPPGGQKRPPSPPSGGQKRPPSPPGGQKRPPSPPGGQKRPPSPPGGQKRPPSPPAGQKRPPSPPKGQKRPPSSPGGGSQNRPPSPPGPPPAYSPPASPPLQTAKAPEELAASTIPFSSFFKKKSASPEGKMKSIYSAKEDSSLLGSSSGVSSVTSLGLLTGSSSAVSLSSTISSLSGSSLSPSSRLLESSSSLLSPTRHLDSASSSSLPRSSSLLESMSSTSFRSLDSGKSGLLLSESTSAKHDIGESKSESVPTTKETEVKAATKPAEKHKISLSDYAKFRKRQQSEDKDSFKIAPIEDTDSVKVAPKELDTKPEPEEAKPDPVVKKPDSVVKLPPPIFAPMAIPEPEKIKPVASEAERKLSVESYEVEELTKTKKVSGDYQRFDPRRKSTEKSSKNAEVKLVTPKPVDAAMRPPTPLDQPTTPTPLSQPTTPTPLGQPTTPVHLAQPTTPTPPVGPTTPIAAPPSEGSSRSTTPGLSRPTTPHDRSRRPSSDQRTRRLSDNSKPKPVLTEEMERQIIFGGALLKGSRLKSNSDNQKPEKESPKSAEKISPKTSPTEKVSLRTTPKESITPAEKVSPKTTPVEKKSPDMASKGEASSRENSFSPDEEDSE